MESAAAPDPPNPAPDVVGTPKPDGGRKSFFGGEVTLLGV